MRRNSFMAIGKVRAMSQSHTFARVLKLTVSVSLLLLAACNGPQQRLDDATRAYDAQDWTKAYADATAAQGEAQPPLKQRAAFVAGLAAYRQDRLDEARSRFLVAESSEDRETSGQAKVMLGHLLTRDGKPAAAASKYDEAAQLLTGEEATSARSLASAARDASKSPTPTPVVSAETDDSASDTAPTAAAAGKSRPAAKPKAPARDAGKTETKSSKPRTATTSKSSTKGGFTIQCGAYVKEADARARAKDLGDEARKAGLPAPQVARVTGRTGKKLWIVSIGSFKTRAEGKKALAKLKVDHAEVLPIED
jgi:cell division septation protein DedD